MYIFIHISKGSVITPYQANVMSLHDRYKDYACKIVYLYEMIQLKYCNYFVMFYI